MVRHLHHAEEVRHNIEDGGIAGQTKRFFVITCRLAELATNGGNSAQIIQIRRPVRISLSQGRKSFQLFFEIILRLFVISIFDAIESSQSSQREPIEGMLGTELL